ncbi:MULTISPECIES: DUF2690 domain-containing protein [unclassified Microbacterium]|uniref:DUF2690 domain-containing protein n=1 Tax=unclassified Microbacterium TaxID=2609290 RepID=UPI002B8AB8C6|nr:DUF2690 domain-containing protein [Microbacterium sp.]HWK76539.1 DUF2690 domain-containing protein [Microbacterium sp.]
MTNMPEADSIAEFAASLRALRLEANSPTLSRLHHDTDISRSVLSDAFGGKRLPSARTVDRIVRSLDNDSTEWVRRRDLLATSLLEGESADTSTEPPESLTATGWPRRTALMVAAAAFACGLIVSGGISWAVTSTVVEQAKFTAAQAVRDELANASTNPRAQINVHNGVDPAMTECVNDAEVATSSPRTNDTLLEIIWSNKCYAGWARVTRYDEQISGNSVTVAIYPETAAQGPDRQAATEPNVQGAYTTLVVRPTPQTRLCTVGAITVDGTSIDLGEPLCI